MGWGGGWGWRGKQGQGNETVERGMLHILRDDQVLLFSEFRDGWNDAHPMSYYD